MRSYGRLEYDQDDAGNPDVLIDKQDLTALYSAIQKYDLQSKQELYNAFKFLGVGFDSNGSTRLGNMALSYDKYNMSQYVNGVRTIPRSWLTGGQNVTLTDNRTANLSISASKTYNAPVKYTLTVPKGWREQQTVVDLSDIYVKAGQLWTEQTFRDKHTDFTHHIHSNSSTSATGRSSTGVEADCNPGGILDGDKQAGNSVGVTTKGGCFNGEFKHWHDYTSHAYNASETKDTAGRPGWAKAQSGYRSPTKGGCYTVRHNHSCSDAPHVKAPCTPGHVNGSGDTEQRDACHQRSETKTHNVPAGSSNCNTLHNDTSDDGVPDHCEGVCNACGSHGASSSHCTKEESYTVWHLSCTKTCHRTGSEFDYATISCTKQEGQTATGWYQTCPKHNRQVLSCLITY